MFEFLFSFQGRTGRAGYFGYAFFWVVAFIGGVLTTAIFLQPLVPFVMIALVVLTLLSGLAVTTRRLHDLGLSFWVVPFMFLVSFAPVFFLTFLLFGAYFAPDLFQTYWGDVQDEGFQEQFINDFQLIFFVSGFIMHGYNMMLLLWPGEARSNRFGAELY